MAIASNILEDLVGLVVFKSHPEWLSDIKHAQSRLCEPWSKPNFDWVDTGDVRQASAVCRYI